MRRRREVPGPQVDIDLYAPEVLQDSTAAFAAIRDAGPVVWLPRHRMWAMGRYDDVRAALRDDQTFVSGRGVAANPVANALGRKTTLSSDADVHTARRRVLMGSLGAKALAPLQTTLDVQAERLVEDLLGRDGFDAVTDFASALPLRVVADLVGVRVTPSQLLRWAAATFDGLGPLNRRSLGATPRALSLLLYSARLRRDRVVPGGWASTVFDAADRGEISTTEAKNMVIDFVAPSLDTTILAAAHMLWRLGVTPGLWDQIRADPDQIPAAVVESVRLASPIRGFTRSVVRGTESGAVRLAPGARVLLLFASANLDAARFTAPESFVLDRPPGGHLGWGNGPHTCVGIHLAKLEMQALLRAMVPHVRSVAVGQPTRLRNNCLQGFVRLPARFA